MLQRNRLTSEEVFQWSEFKLFCERAGIILDLSLKSLTIKLEAGCALLVTQEYTPRGIPSGPNTDDEEGAKV